MHLRRPIALAVLLLAGVACDEAAAPGGDAGAVADWFVDKHYVEMDQASALSVSTGAAKAALEKELAMVAEVRGSGPAPTSAARVYWKRDGEPREKDGQVEVRYVLSMNAASMRIEKAVRVRVAKSADIWKVVAFVDQDRAPAAAE